MTEFSGQQATIKLNRHTTQRLKDIAQFYKEENLTHQLNLIISSLHEALKLNEDGSLTNHPNNT